jgi:2-keto-4-pentenoate hydratase/2-oxohepta-3-ene-1,7-dioic acid hydratase in catechol pathway
MDDKEIMGRITELIDTEHELRTQHARGELTSEQERERLRSTEEALDQCWDLLRQRRARRQYGEDPNSAEARPVPEVEGYQQLCPGGPPRYKEASRDPGIVSRGHRGAPRRRLRRSIVRIARFAMGDGVGYGVVEGDSGQPQTIAELYGHPFGVDPAGVRLTGNRYPLAEVRLLAPVLPSKVIAVGKNYAEHVKEMGGTDLPVEPVLFLKPSTSVTGPGDRIAYPVKITDRVDYEGELAVIIGRLCRDVPVERAAEVIFGYTCANDVTARDLQARDGQWTRAKGFDTFCPLGPWMETGTDPADLGLTTTVNGSVRQHARTSELLWDVPSLVAFVSSVMTLLPGDVLLTGTPEGVGPLTDGDEVSVTIESIGTLTNRVVIRD